MKNQADYSQYKCPFEHVEKECGHELRGPQGYEDTDSVWCRCGFSGPIFCMDPEKLRLVKKEPSEPKANCPPLCSKCGKLHNWDDGCKPKGLPERFLLTDGLRTMHIISRDRAINMAYDRINAILDYLREAQK